MEDRESRPVLDRHRTAADANDFAREQLTCREDAALDHPQPGERIRGRRKLQSWRAPWVRRRS